MIPLVMRNQRQRQADEAQFRYRQQMLKTQKSLSLNDEFGRESSLKKKNSMPNMNHSTRVAKCHRSISESRKQLSFPLGTQPTDGGRSTKLAPKVSPENVSSTSYNSLNCETNANIKLTKSNEKLDSQCDCTPNKESNETNKKKTRTFPFSFRRKREKQ